MTKYHQTIIQIEEDAAYVAKAKLDSRSFEFLYNKYHHKIFSYIYKTCGNENDAGDITTDVFCIALKNIHKYQNKGLPFSAWLYRIAIHELYNFRKRNNKVLLVELGNEQIIELSEEQPEDTDTWLRCLTKSMQGLKEEEFTLLQLRFTGEKSFREIGDTLLIGEDLAKTKTYRVLKKLKPLIEFCYAKIQGR